MFTGLIHQAGLPRSQGLLEEGLSELHLRLRIPRCILGLPRGVCALGNDGDKKDACDKVEQDRNFTVLAW